MGFFESVKSLFKDEKDGKEQEFEVEIAEIAEQKAKDEIDEREAREKAIQLKNGFTRNQAHTSTKITTSKNNLTREQLRIFYQCVTLIDPLKDKDFNYYTISVKDFCQKMGFNTTNRSWLIKELKKMLRQVFEIESPNGDYIGYTIFSSLRYRNAEQQIDIRFNNEMMPFLLELKNHFTHIEQVCYIQQFKSKYAIRFYTLLKDYRLMSYRDFEVEKLKEILELPKSYANWTRFCEKVLKPAIDDINESSDLWVKEPEIIKRKGKKVLAFRLYFGNKATQMAEDFCIELKKIYTQRNDFNIFNNALWLNKNIMNKPARITKIDANRGTYYELFCDISQNQCYGTPNKQEFIDKIINGIYCAIEWKYENEKQEFMEVSKWQEHKDKLKAFKEYFNTHKRQSRLNSFIKKF